MNKVKVLFVCTGNTCRSPMAEGILKQLSEQCDVLSAGIHAQEGDTASAQAVRVMAKRGIDISSHRAANVTESVMQSADIVLAMTKTHQLVLQQMFPQTAGKVLTLGAFAGENIDVPDPFMGDEGVYEACAAVIETLIRAALPKLLRMVQADE